MRNFRFSHCRRIETFDHPSFVSLLTIDVVESMISIWPQVISLPQVIRENDIGWDAVFVFDSSVVTDRKRRTAHWSSQRFPDTVAR